MKTRFLLLALLCSALAVPVAAENDTGLLLNAGVRHRIGRKWDVKMEAEMRTRNDFRSMDRVSVSLDASYRLCRYLKASATYVLLVDHHLEKTSFGSDGLATKWLPDYWGTRQRFSLSLTGSAGTGWFTFSLRERWQFTYKPERTVDRLDYTSLQWEDYAVAGSRKHVLRSRLKVDCDIPSSDVDPYASFELFNGWSLQKTRLVAGVEWKVDAKNSLALSYLLECPAGGSTSSTRHLVGAYYSFKF